MKIPFVGPAYAARSLNADAQRAVNCFLEMDNASPRAPVALYGTPGTVLRFTLGDSPVRGSIRQGDYSYWVAGDSVYRVEAVTSTTYTATLLGAITTSTGQVSMASNGTEVLIVDGLAGWLATSSALTQIADADFPNGVTRAAYQDGYFIVTGDGTQKFYINETPNTGSAWNGADFGSAEGSPDNTVGLISDHRELWLGGSKSFEVFVNTGNTDFPFERSGNTFIEHGCASGATLDKLDNTVFWLGADDLGTGIVWRAQGYTPTRISNHALEKAIQGYSTISDAFAFTYQQEGHGFYVLTFPTAGKTWVYDVATNEWHERAWRNPSTNELTRWRPNCYVFFNDEHLVGDFETGKVYALDLDTYTDNGDPLLFLRTTQCLNAEKARLFLEELIIDMETGVGLATGQGSDPQIMLRYSKDGGRSWSGIKTKSMGAAGEYARRVKFGPMGAGRDWVFEVSITDPVKRAIFGAFARVTKGSA
jgi:hypothetical protein